MSNFGPTFEISLDISLNSDPTTLSNIIRITNTTENNDGWGDKIVNVNLDDDGRFGFKINTGDSSSMFTESYERGSLQWTNLKIIQEKTDEDEYILKIFIDGVQMVSTVSNAPQQYHNVKVYASDNNLPSADVQIRNFYLSTETLYFYI